MDFLQEAISEPDDFIDPAGCASVPPTGTETLTLDITYDDPELQALFSVASSKWANKNLTDSLKQGRVTNDLWALGLPSPDAVTGVSITNNQCLCVKVVVTCDELVDLSSLLDPANKYRQQLRITNISIVDRKNAAIVLDQQSSHDDHCTISNISNDDTVGISPITTVSDYYRRCHLDTLPSINSTVPPITATCTLHEPFQANSEPIAKLTDTTRRGNFAELEDKLFSTELELGLQSRRLRDAHRELQRCQAQRDRLELELASAKAQFGEAGEDLARDVNHVTEQADLDESHHPAAVIEAPESARVVIDAAEPLSCGRCEVRSQSARLSELQLRAMEFRVTLSDRRQTEAESLDVRLLDALQLERRMRVQLVAEVVAERQKQRVERQKRRVERRMRLQLEAELVAERQKRRGAEAVVEAIANEAKWPFVMPDMLDVFLKLEGIVEEVSRGGKES